MSTTAIPVAQHRLIRGNEITWAGTCPWSVFDVYGAYDGSLLFISGADGPGQPFAGPKLFDEAVNSAAFSNDWAVVGSRTQVAFLRRGEQQAHEPAMMGYLPFGVHGVLKTAYNSFFAAAGSNGLLLLEPGLSHVRPQFFQLGRNPRDAYQIVNINADDQGQTLAVANRSDGMYALHYQGGKKLSPVVGFQFDGLDVVSLAAAPWADSTRGAFAFTREGILIYLEDVLDQDCRPVFIDPDCFGTPYSIRSFDRHLALLTSRQFLVLPRFDVPAPATTDSIDARADAFALDFLPDEILMEPDGKLYMLGDGKVGKAKLWALAQPDGIAIPRRPFTIDYRVTPRGWKTFVDTIAAPNL